MWKQILVSRVRWDHQGPCTQGLMQLHVHSSIGLAKAGPMLDVHLAGCG